MLVQFQHFIHFLCWNSTKDKFKVLLVHLCILRTTVFVLSPLSSLLAIYVNIWEPSFLFCKFELGPREDVSVPYHCWFRFVSQIVFFSLKEMYSPWTLPVNFCTVICCLCKLRLYFRIQLAIFSLDNPCFFYACHLYFIMIMNHNICCSPLRQYLWETNG